MDREEACNIILKMLKDETDINKRQALDIALDSIAAVDRVNGILVSYGVYTKQEKGE